MSIASPARGLTYSNCVKQKMLGYKSRKVFCSGMLLLLAILPEGSVRDEPFFLLLLAGLAVLVSAAMYLRFRRKRNEENLQ